MFRQSLRCCQEQAQRSAYFIQRNSNGNLPVYTDIRNAGSRFQVQVRNIEGSVEALAKDLRSSLFPAESYEGQKARIHTNHQHVVITGGRWKQEVCDWLKAKGF